MNVELQGQLVKKFQLAHFVAARGKPFKLYSDFVKFERNVHSVNLGTGFLTDTACKEILLYLAQSIIEENITLPLNESKVFYYSIHNDGSSSAKTNNEKELFIMKTAPSGIIKFNVMSLEEPEEGTAEGLKAALENSLGKLNLTVDRKTSEVGKLVLNLLCIFFIERKENTL